MHGNRHAQIGTVRMLEEVVRAFDVVNIKTGTLEGLEDSDRSQRWQVLAHAGSGMAISISTFTGSSESFLSGGKGSPSFCRLSR